MSAISMDTVRYQYRPSRLEDVPALHRLLHAIAAVQPHNYAPTLEDVERDYDDPWYDPEHDSRVALAPDGTLVGSARCMVNPEPRDNVRAFLEYDLHPEHEQREAETALLDWLEARGAERVRAQAAAQGNHGPRLLRLACWDTEHHRIAEYERRGFQPVRYFCRMRRDLRQPIPAPVLPPGLTLHGYSPALDARIHAAHNEAFRDHWGSDPISAADWQQFIVGHSTFRPDLTFAILDGDEVAAYSINRFDANECERTGYRVGWIGSLGTRRPWRQRGLASALLAASMRAFLAAGLDYAGLGVDTENPTGALRLYEQHGFAPYLRIIAFQKELDA